MLNRERNRIVTEFFLAVEENNNGKDSRKKTTKMKRQDKKPLLEGIFSSVSHKIASIF